MGALYSTSDIRFELDLPRTAVVVLAPTLQFLTFAATFEGGTCGVWRRSIDGNTGDIVRETVARGPRSTSVRR
jgi:hypothetical protein